MTSLSHSLRRPSRRDASVAAVVVLAIVLGLAGAAGLLIQPGNLMRWSAALRAARGGNGVDLLRLDRLPGLYQRLEIVSAAALLAAAGLVCGRAAVAAGLRHVLADLRRAAGRAVTRTRTAARRRPMDLLVLGLAMALMSGALVRFSGQPMRCDEARSFLDFGLRPLPAALIDYTSTNNHLLHSCLLRLSVLTLGDREWMVRLPAMLAGVAMLPLLYQATRAHYGRQAALWAVALAGPSAYLVDFATNARGYTLMACFVLVVLATLPRLRRGGHEGWGLVTLGGVLALASVPVALYGLVGAALWLAATTPAGRRRAVGTRMLIAGAAIATLTAAVYAPAWIFSGAQAAAVLDRQPLAGSSPAPRTGVLLLFGHLARLLGSWSAHIVYTWPTPLTLVMGGGVVVQLLAWLGRRRRRSPLLPCMAAAAVLMTWLAGVAPPPWSLFYLYPPALMAAAGGLAEVSEKLPAPKIRDSKIRFIAPFVACGLAAVAAFALFNSPYPRSTPWEVGYPRARTLVERFAAPLRGGDLLVAQPVAAAPLSYYLYRSGFLPSHLAWSRPPDRPAAGRPVLFLDQPSRASILLRHQLRQSGYRVRKTLWRSGRARLLLMRSPLTTPTR